MSASATDVLDRQRQEIQRLVAGTLPVIDQQGIVRRSLLVGLWQAAIGSLIEIGDPKDVAALLLDRAMAIPGQGRNADSLPLKLTGDARMRRISEASDAARIVLEALEPFAASLGEDEEQRFPEDMLDTIVEILVEAWGQTYVRAALADQATALDRGESAPILPTEPTTLNYVPKAPLPPPRTVPRPVPTDAPAPPAPVEISVESPAPVAIVEVREPTPPEPPRPRTRRSQEGRRIDVHIDSDILENGYAVYAVACLIVDMDGRRELREISSVLPDATGRLAPLVAVIDVLSSLDLGEGEAIRVLSPSKALIEGVTNPTSRGRSDSGRWEAIERLCEGRRVEWVASRMGIGTELAERCDRMVRVRSEQHAKENAA